MTTFRSIADPADPHYRSKLADDIQQTMRDYNAQPRANERPSPPPGVAPRRAIRASPFIWCEPSTVRPRRWLYGGHYVRGFVSTTVAPGGVGKSSLAIAETLAMVTGRNLVGEQPTAPVTVWYFNGEDPADEIQRRFIAAMLRFGIGPGDVAGRLFADSGRATDLVLAYVERGSVVISAEVSEEIRSTIRANSIDVVIVDPFVSSHRVPENDNGAMDAVMKEWGRIAESTGCSIELVHHSRKTGGAEVTVEDGRGASALVSAARSARALNGMTKDEAEKAGVKSHRSYFRLDNGKANMAAPPESSRWFHLVPIPLGNGVAPDDGDDVAVVESWNWPDALADVTAADVDVVLRVVRGGRWRKDPQASDWVGKAVAEALELDLSEPADSTKIKGLLRVWLGSGALVVREYKDDTHRLRKYVEAGDR